MKYYVVKYSGPFGFIKPWTAVRDKETFSQQFLTPSVIEGMEKKIFPETLFNKGIKKIIRHKLTYSAISVQQEVTQTRGWEKKTTQRQMIRNRSVLDRGVMVNPVLYLAFTTIEDANQASIQHLCLCRNEDVMIPDCKVLDMIKEDFDALDGFEMIYGNNEDAFLVGFNRFDEDKPMYGSLEIVGNPVKNM